MVCWRGLTMAYAYPNLNPKLGYDCRYQCYGFRVLVVFSFIHSSEIVVMLSYSKIIIFVLLLLLPLQYGHGADEAQIRSIVEHQLERKLDELTLSPPETMPASITPPTEALTTASIESAQAEEGIGRKLRELDKTVGELKATAAAHGLEISGFFDVNAKTGNTTDQTFSLGSVELDLDYVHDDHFGAASALVLCGNSSNADYGAPAAVFCGNSGVGGLSGGNTMAGIMVAMIDYHWFDDRVPPRGRIFNRQSFHIQAGRFDLPFGIDYQNFANKDRVTVTPPLTTSRMQLGGYNADGLRSYGVWDNVNYSVFWTDAFYADDGHTVGGRLGMTLGQRPYSVHNPHKGIAFGISHLSELNGDNHIRNSVYGADLSIDFGIWHLENELMLLQAHQAQTFDVDGRLLVDDFGHTVGKGHQFGYHSTLVVDLEAILKYRLKAFVRFSRWQPTQTVGLDYDGKPVAIDDVSMLSLGFNYRFNDYLQLKFEYSDSLGTSTAERYFDHRVGIGQLVVSF